VRCTKIRDERTRFAQDAELCNPPDLSGFDIATIHGMTRTVHSFKAILHEDGILLALRTDKETQFLRLNPEVVKGLGLLFLATGIRQKWLSVESTDLQSDRAEH
jgi:hypothetical protein